MKDLVRERLEHRPCPRHGPGIAANHDREPPFTTLAQAAAHRRVENVDPLFGRLARNAANDIGADGTQVDVDVAALCTRQDAVRAERHLFAGLVGRQGSQDDVRRGRDLAGTAHGASPVLLQFAQRLLAQVGHREREV